MGESQGPSLVSAAQTRLAEAALHAVQHRAGGAEVAVADAVAPVVGGRALQRLTASQHLTGTWISGRAARPLLRRGASGRQPTTCGQRQPSFGGVVGAGVAGRRHVRTAVFRPAGVAVASQAAPGGALRLCCTVAVTRGRHSSPARREASASRRTFGCTGLAVRAAQRGRGEPRADVRTINGTRKHLRRPN
jgi:hypothetical protein